MGKFSLKEAVTAAHKYFLTNRKKPDFKATDVRDVITDFFDEIGIRGWFICGEHFYPVLTGHFMSGSFIIELIYDAWFIDR